MNDTLDRVVNSKEAAHRAATEAYSHAQTLLLNGARVRITCAEDQDDITIRQRKFLHGPVFGQISEQVVVDGVRYTTEIWKEYFRKRFLPDVFVMKRVPRFDPQLGRLVSPKRATPMRERQSTEDLGIRRYSQYIDQVIDTAVVEFGVLFEFLPSERDAVRWKPKPRAAKAPTQREEATC